MTHTHHRIDYVEIPAADLSASTNFYTEVFGWRFRDYGPTYVGILAPDGEAEVGGITTLTEPTGERGGTLVVLFSAELDATLAAVEAAGGTIVDPPTEFPGGRRFSFADPGGTVLGVWAER